MIERGKAGRGRGRGVFEVGGAGMWVMAREYWGSWIC